MVLLAAALNSKSMPPKSPPNPPPRPQEESDEPVIAGEARYTPKKGAVGLGEWIGQQRQQELERAAKQRAEITAGGEYVRQSVAAGIETKQSAEKKIAQKAAETEAVQQRRQAEQAQKQAREAAFRVQEKKEREHPSPKNSDADEEKSLQALRLKFDHAKVELEKEKRAETSVINKLRNQHKTLENDLVREERELKQSERQEQQGEKQSSQVEHEIEELKSQEKELTTSHGKLGPKEQSELRQVRNKLSNLSFKLRLGERKALAGSSTARRDASKLQQGQHGLKDLQKEISDHETRLSVIEGYLREWQSKHTHHDLARVWREFELDLRNKLGLHIFR